MRIIYVLNTYCKVLTDPAASDHLALDLAIRRRRLRVIQDRSLSLRNRKRFPDEFLFELTAEEFASLKSRLATSSWGGRRKRPLAFTEHGAIQAATILNSPREVEMSLYVVRAFVKLSEVLSSTLACISESDSVPNLSAVHSQRAIVVEYEPVKA
jgi:hypothetical protein